MAHLWSYITSFFSTSNSLTVNMNKKCDSYILWVNSSFAKEAAEDLTSKQWTILNNLPSISGDLRWKVSPPPTADIDHISMDIKEFEKTWLINIFGNGAKATIA